MLLTGYFLSFWPFTVPLKKCQNYYLTIVPPLASTAHSWPLEVPLWFVVTVEARERTEVKLYYYRSSIHTVLWMAFIVQYLPLAITHMVQVMSKCSAGLTGLWSVKSSRLILHCDSALSQLTAGKMHHPFIITANVRRELVSRRL